MTTNQLRLGTRASPLAKWQAEWVAGQLAACGVAVELVWITTAGDATARPLAAAGGQGLFTKEIQRGLLDRRIDLAVHSLKDLPTDAVAGLVVAAIPLREDPRDVLVSRSAKTLEELPNGVCIGTGSRRRQSQLLHLRPDLLVQDIRGNVDSRLRKLDEGQYDAIVLAKAGLNRLGLAHRATQVFSQNVLLPAVGQGALGLEIRCDDKSAHAAVQQLNDPTTQAEVTAERALLARLQAGCMAPVGAWGRVVPGGLRLTAAVLSADGRQRVSVTIVGDVSQPESVGHAAADELFKLGARDLIATARS